MAQHPRWRAIPAYRAVALAFACATTLLIPLANADSASNPACPSGAAERLGVKFYAVCPAGRDAPFWISQPLHCGAGDHDHVACPFATSLVRKGGAQSSVPTKPQAVAMTDAFTAHRLCGMRFGGLLPSRSQRLAAKSSLGIATLLATEDSAGELSLSELPEWVAEGECDNPTLPGAHCRFASYPPQSVDLTLQCWTGRVDWP